MRIPFLDLTRQHRELEQELSVALRSVLDGGHFILGHEVDSFEAEWASYCSVNAAVGVGTGTEAITLALMASGAICPGAGDEVITTPLTSGYTALAILNAGGIPVFADIDPRNCTIDPDSIAQMITARTRAIVPVHLYGQLCDMDSICDLAARHGLFVLEDGAQAHGAHHNGQRAGSFGSAAAFSFYPTKNLGGCGDGGAVVTSDERLAERIRSLRQGGHEPAMTEGIQGRNSRLDELQAAVLRVKLRQLERWNEQRRSLSRFYSEALASVEDLRLPLYSDGHVYHLYVVQHPRREALRAFLAELGIETLIHYPEPLHRQRLFQRPNQLALPITESVTPRLLSLPLYPQLSTSEAQAVAEAVLTFALNE